MFWSPHTRSGHLGNPAAPSRTYLVGEVLPRLEHHLEAVERNAGLLSVWYFSSSHRTTGGRGLHIRVIVGPTGPSRAGGLLEAKLRVRGCVQRLVLGG